MQAIVQWLERHHTDGVNLGIKELLLYKSKTGLLNLNPRKANQAKLAGAYLAKTKGRGMEFDEARHYQPGDDIRAIDWRVTARTGKTHTKLYREEKERPVFVLADLTSSHYFGTQLLFKSVQVAHLAALIAWAAHNRGDRLGGLIVNDQQHREYKPLTRQKAVLSFLNGLVELHQHSSRAAQQQVNLTQACARLRRLARPGSLICVISDFQQLDDLAQQHLATLSRHCEVIAYGVSDPFEHQLPESKQPQQLAVTDGQQQQQIMLGESKTRQLYQQQHQQTFARIQQQLLKAGAQWLPISAGRSLESQLADLNWLGARRTS